MTQSLQEHLNPDGLCFGCGPANERGLRLQSFLAEDGTTVADFTPWPEHNNGLGFLNGGIIATLLDCHSGVTAFHEAEVRGWERLGGAAFSHVTAGIEVRYRRPAPLHDTVRIVGEIESSTEPEILVAVRMEYDGKVRAEASVSWKRWRPRP